MNCQQFEPGHDLAKMEKLGPVNSGPDGVKSKQRLYPESKPRALRLESWVRVSLVVMAGVRLAALHGLRAMCH